jgi:MFS family permease
MKKKHTNIVDSKLFIIIAITIGGSLEWYEIGLFISWPLFIQNEAAGFDISIAESINTGTILLLVLFALANGGARAIGGWFFGKKGDETGRQKALSLTLLMATLPSCFIALLSFFLPYHYWLTYATIIFAVIKLLQGMPAGGEVPGAICYLTETADAHTQKHPFSSSRYLCSYALLGPQIGLALSATVCLLLKSLYSIEYLVMYAWRYVFIFSGVLGICGYFMRKKLHETTQYLEFKSHHKVTHEPLKILWSKHSHKVLLAVTLSIYEIIAFTITSAVPYYYSNPPFSFNQNIIFIFSLCYSCLCILLIPTMGAISSKFLNIPWLKISVVGITIFSVLLFWSLLKGEFILSLISGIIMTFFMSIQVAILPSILAKIFPIQVRYTGIAFSFNICDGILWSAFTGICFIFVSYKSPAFLLILPFAAIIFFIGLRISHSYKNIYKLLR